MDAREFDDLIARIASASSRRHAVKGVLGGALAGAGVVAVADAKGKKGRKGKAASEHFGGHGKRTICLCVEEATTTSTSTTTIGTTTAGRGAGRAQARALVCETKRFKKKKAKRKLRNNPGSYRGPCAEPSTSTSTTSTTVTTVTTPPN